MPKAMEPDEPTELYELSQELKETGAQEPRAKVANTKEMSDQESGEGCGQSLVSVSVLISVLAIASALALIPSHRAETEAGMASAQSTDQWQSYLMYRSDMRGVTASLDLVTLLAPANAAAVQARAEEYKSRIAKYESEMKNAQERALDDEEAAARAGGRVDSIGLGQCVLQIAVLVSSITLYTRKRLFFWFGVGFGALGVGMIALAVFSV